MFTMLCWFAVRMKKHFKSAPEGNSKFCFPSSPIFACPDFILRKHREWRKNKTVFLRSRHWAYIIIINFQTCSSQSSFFDHFFIDLFHLSIHAVYLHSWKAMLGLIPGKENTVKPVLRGHPQEMVGWLLNP